jgi:hypothetical protein
VVLGCLPCYRKRRLLPGHCLVELRLVNPRLERWLHLITVLMCILASRVSIFECGRAANRIATHLAGPIHSVTRDLSAATGRQHLRSLIHSLRLSPQSVVQISFWYTRNPVPSPMTSPGCCLASPIHLCPSRSFAVFAAPSHRCRYGGRYHTTASSHLLRLLPTCKTGQVARPALLSVAPFTAMCRSG